MSEWFGLIRTQCWRYGNDYSRGKFIVLNNHCADYLSLPPNMVLVVPASVDLVTSFSNVKVSDKLVDNTFILITHDIQTINCGIDVASPKIEIKVFVVKSPIILKQGELFCPLLGDMDMG